MKIKTNSIFYILIYILLTLVCVVQCLENSSISLALTGIIILISLFSKLEQSLILLFICLPFFNTLNSNIGSTSLYYILVLIFLLKYFTSNTSKYKLRTKLLLSILICVCTIYNIVSKEYFTWLILLLPLIFSYKENILKDNFSKIIKFYAFSVIISSFFGLYMLEHGLSIYTRSYVWNNGVSYVRFSGLIGDSNVYSQLLLIIISLLLIDHLKNKNSKLNILLILMLMFFGVQTYSKMNLLCSALIILIYIMYKVKDYLKSNQHKFKFVLFLFLIGIAALIVVTYLINNLDNTIISSYITRFNAKDLMTGRLDVYSHFIDMWKLNPIGFIFGMGFKLYCQPFYLPAGYIVIYAHNLYIECISLYGIIGFLIILFFVLSKIISCIKIKKDYIWLLPTFILFLTGITLHGNLEFSFFFNIILVLATLYIN